MTVYRKTHRWILDEAGAGGTPAGATVWAKEAGIYKCDTACNHHHRSAKWFAPHIITKGEGYFRAGGVESRLRKGDFFCLWPGIQFEYGGLAEAPWGLLYLALEGDGVESLMRACGVRPDRLWFRPAMPELVEQVLLDIHAAMGRRKWEEAYRNVGRLYELVPACTAPSRTGASLLHDPNALVAQAGEVAAFSPGMNVHELAGALGISRTKLFTAFREAEGRTPIEFLTEVRLAKAKQLMTSTDLKLSAIAQMSGFAGEKYFLRRFRQVEGCTPSEYRTRRRKR